MFTQRNSLVRIFAIVLTFLSVFTFQSQLLAEQQEVNKPADFFEMSLTELMAIEIDVPATITETDPMKTPASVTVITADEIARTPARTLMDLLEIYVPGAFWMNHSVGPLPGIRGTLVDRPYKFLVNLNGININIKAHYGARLELVNWDLNDIERIEIIRGPGSVTYGPGAIGGVINIYTKTASTAPGVEIGGHFWDKYDSIGNYIGYGRKTDKLDLYTYFSIVQTAGHSPDLFGVDKNTSGYVGSTDGLQSNRPAATYLSDYDGEAQIKAHIDVHFKDTWRFWARYVTSSHELMQGSAVKYQFGDDWKDFRQTRFRYYQFALENKTPFTENWNIESTFGLSSIDVHNVEKWDSKIVNNDRDNLQNIKWIWSENEYYAQFMLNYKPDKGKIKAALGFELSYDTIGPAWGKDKDDGLRLSEAMISGPSSDAYGSGTGQVKETTANYFAIGNGWETYSHALLGELNIKWTEKTTTLLSARLDKHSYTDYMFSPRFAWIQGLRKDEYLKFIAQRSVRMNTQEELYINETLGNDNKPEILDTLELIYSGKFTKNLSFQSSIFYNQNEVIAWDADLRRAAPIGELKTIGLELEAKYEKDSFNLGVNHSFVKQLDWKLADNVTASGISYSDYYNATSGVTDKGNDLSNWANHATKLFTNIGLLDDKLTLHGDVQIFWGFEGLKDGLDALAEAGGNAANIAHIKRQNGYDMQAMAGVSLTYHINKSSAMTVFVQGIPVIGDNKRYSYSSGYKNKYPDKTSWIEEPIVVGFRYHVRF